MPGLYTIYPKRIYRMWAIHNRDVIEPPKSKRATPVTLTQSIRPISPTPLSAHTAYTKYIRIYSEGLSYQKAQLINVYIQQRYIVDSFVCQVCGAVTCIQLEFNQLMKCTTSSIGGRLL
jgi:hypothetical protein